MKYRIIHTTIFTFIILILISCTNNNNIEPKNEIETPVLPVKHNKDILKAPKDEKIKDEKSNKESKLNKQSENFEYSNNSKIYKRHSGGDNQSERDLQIIENYRYETMKYIYNLSDSLNREEIDILKDKYTEEWRTWPLEGYVYYSPDSVFRIYIYEYEFCGAYCSLGYLSWLNYNIDGKEKSIDCDFLPMESIHKLPDNKYLIIYNHIVRASSTLFFYNLKPILVSFSNDSVIISPVKYNLEKEFLISQLDVYVEEPYLIYNEKDLTLSYFYIKDNLWRDGDLETIFEGNFKYKNGEFILEKEEIKPYERNLREN